MTHQLDRCEFLAFWAEWEDCTCDIPIIPRIVAAFSDFAAFNMLKPTALKLHPSDRFRLLSEISPVAWRVPSEASEIFMGMELITDPKCKVGGFSIQQKRPAT